MSKVLLKKFHENWTTESRVIHARISIPKQYQIMMSSVGRVKFLKTKVIFRYHTKGVSNQVSLNSDHEIESYSCSNFSTKMGKTKKSEKFSGLHSGAIKRLQIGAGFRDYKSRQEGLQIWAALGISNRGKKITNQSRNFKLGKEGFQIGAGKIGVEQRSCNGFFWFVWVKNGFSALKEESFNTSVWDIFQANLGVLEGLIMLQGGVA